MPKISHLSRVAASNIRAAFLPVELRSAECFNDIWPTDSRRIDDETYNNPTILSFKGHLFVRAVRDHLFDASSVVLCFVILMNHTPARIKTMPATRFREMCSCKSRYEKPVTEAKLKAVNGCI
jgi:hypothetical protein